MDHEAAPEEGRHGNAALCHSPRPSGNALCSILAGLAVFAAVVAAAALLPSPLSPTSPRHFLFRPRSMASLNTKSMPLKYQTPDWRVLLSPGEAAQPDRSVVKAVNGAVASDEGRCSVVGRDILQKAGGNAVDAAIATVFCAGVLNPVASGIGGGAFMLIRLANGSSEFIDCRETAPGASTETMYQGREDAIAKGALSVAVPGEVRGLHLAWERHGSLPWRDLLAPAIVLAQEGFQVSPYLGYFIQQSAAAILADRGLRSVFAPGGTLLKPGDLCVRTQLALTLERVAEEGPAVLYGGDLGRQLVEEVQRLGGILSLQDLEGYRAELSPAVESEVFGFHAITIPPPSGGGVSILEVLKILEGFDLPLASEGPLGVHRMVEAMKHASALRMELGDPHFVNTTQTVQDMLSDQFSSRLRLAIVDNTTFPPSHYGRPAAQGGTHPLFEQLNDHGTSHTCVIDKDRNAVSVTSTVNGPWGAGILSPATGIVLNNEMADFAIPSRNRSDFAPPPAPSNFIRPGKRPLSSMAPFIVLQHGVLRAVMGGSGGPFIISSVIQVFLNYFLKGMSPVDAVKAPRVHHQLVPNVLLYESNHTVIHGPPISLDTETITALQRRGHQMMGFPFSGVAQIILQDLEEPVESGSKPQADSGRVQRKPTELHLLLQSSQGAGHAESLIKSQAAVLGLGGAKGHKVVNLKTRRVLDTEGMEERKPYHGLLTAVSDPRKDGEPAGY